MHAAQAGRSRASSSARLTRRLAYAMTRTLSSGPDCPPHTAPMDTTVTACVAARATARHHARRDASVKRPETSPAHCRSCRCQAPTGGNHKANATSMAVQPYRKKGTKGADKAQVKRAAQRVCWSHRYVGPTVTAIADGMRQDGRREFSLVVKTSTGVVDSVDNRAVDLLAEAFTRHVAVTPIRRSMA